MICSNTSGDIVFMWYKEMRGEGEVGGVRRGGERRLLYTFHLDAFLNNKCFYI